MSDNVLQGVSGAVGGMLAMTATYPLVYLSTRAQATIADPKTKVHTVTEAVLETIKREGIVGLYSGLSSSLLGIAVTNGVYYYFYERSRGLILAAKPTPAKGLSTLESMLTGCLAGSATTIISNPLWVIQTAQATRTMPVKASAGADAAVVRVPIKKLGFIATIQNIISTDGIAAFMRGIGPALILVINPVLQYTVFEQLKNVLIARRSDKLKLAGAATTVAVLTDMDFFFLGMLSKLVATATTYPYIVVKSRLQAGHTKYKSALDGIMTILKYEGVEGLYRGIGSKLVQSMLTAGILFVCQKRVFELTKKALSPVLVK